MGFLYCARKAFHVGALISGVICLILLVFLPWHFALKFFIAYSCFIGMVANVWGLSDLHSDASIKKLLGTPDFAKYPRIDIVDEWHEVRGSSRNSWTAEVKDSGGIMLLAEQFYGSWSFRISSCNQISERALVHSSDVLFHETLEAAVASVNGFLAKQEDDAQIAAQAVELARQELENMSIAMFG